MNNLNMKYKIMLLAGLDIFSILLLVIVSAVSVGKIRAITIILSILLIGASVALAFLVYSSIMGALGKFNEIINELAQGNFRDDISPRLLARKDDFGFLGNNLKTLKENINTLVGRVDNQVQSMDKTLLTIGKDITDLNQEISGVSDNADDLASGMTETAASADHLAEMSADIDAASKNIASKAKSGVMEVGNIYSRATKIKSEAAVTRQKTEALSVELTQSLEEALKDIEVVKKIHVLSEAIMNVTHETNLLSLNAQIEAARAGDSGRGFAVVANQIGKLAEQSKQTAVQIDAITESVQEAVSRLTDDTRRLLSFITDDLPVTFDNFANAAVSYGKDAGFMDDMVADFAIIANGLNKDVDILMQSIEEIRKNANGGAQSTDYIANSSLSLKMHSDNIFDEFQSTRENMKRLNEEIAKFQISYENLGDDIDLLADDFGMGFSDTAAIPTEDTGVSETVVTPKANVDAAALRDQLNITSGGLDLDNLDLSALGLDLSSVELDDDDLMMGEEVSEVPEETVQESTEETGESESQEIAGETGESDAQEVAEESAKKADGPEPSAGAIEAVRAMTGSIEEPEAEAVEESAEEEPEAETAEEPAEEEPVASEPVETADEAADLKAKLLGPDGTIDLDHLDLDALDIDISNVSLDDED